MQMTGEQQIPASRARVWEALNDPEVLRVCIPGCQTLVKEADDRLAATVEIKIGPIGARFKGAVQLGDIDPTNGYTITGEGNGGIAGTARGGAKVGLLDAADGATLLTYTVDAQVGGRLAQLGGPIIDATAKQLAGRFFTKFAETVGGAEPDVETAAVSPQGLHRDTVRSSPVPSSAAVARPAPTATGVGATPIVWVLVAVIAALAGFLIGHGGSDGAGPSLGLGSDWSGLAIGLLVIVVAGAAFEHGRRAGATTLVLDDVLLSRLTGGPDA